MDDEGIIKVLTGVRRCGKSTILEQIREELVSKGIPPKNILHFNLDSKKYHKIVTSDQLEILIESEIQSSDEKFYLFVDEIQNVQGFEPLVNAYREEGYSVFITGSNSYLLSGDLVTKLTGRYIEFDIHPFSFSEMKEYYELNGIPFDTEMSFQDYLFFGGYPKRFQYQDDASKYDYICSVIKETIVKDILGSRTVRNKVLLEKLMDYIFANPGLEGSSTSIANYLRSEHINTQYQTVLRYMDLIFSSKLASKCERYDIIGKEVLKTFYKAYPADPSIYAMYPRRRTSLKMGMALESIVYRELVSRGYSVSIGKLRDLEVDFVVEYHGNTAYVQVTYHMDDPKTEEREERPLLKIKDAYPKYIMTMDPVCFDNRGIHRLNIVRDFLLGDKFII